jgi:FkbM family methyltransferase
MAFASIPLAFRDRWLTFQFPDAGNMRQHVMDVLKGACYPIPALPEGYPFKVIVDIGANVGASAFWFLKVAPDAKIVCFEPAAENFGCLQANMKPFPNVQTFHCGLFSEDRDVDLHLGNNQCMQHSVSANHETGERLERITLKRASAEFDRLGLDHISLLKIDTEGCEVPILEDLGARLERVDQVHVEWHSEEDRRRIDDILAGRFMLASSVGGPYHRGNAVYVAREVANAMPWVEQRRIPRPQ